MEGSWNTVLQKLSTRNPREQYTQRLIEATPCDDLENIRRLVNHRKTLRDS